jgi:hypothetical protein
VDLGEAGVPARQLSGEGGAAMSEQRSLIDLLDEVRPRALGRGGNDGALRLLRDLVRRGLSEDAIPVAAKLVLALDTPTVELER